MMSLVRRQLDCFRSYVTRYRKQQRDELQFCMDRPIYVNLVAR